MTRTVMDAMHRGVVTCKVNTTVDEIAKIIIDNDVAAVIVTDECLDACGVVTKTDLIKYYGKDLSALTAEDIMSPKLVTVSPETTVADAIQRMLQEGVHQLVVVTEARLHHRPVAIFTTGDVVALMAGKTGQQSGD